MNSNAITENDEQMPMSICVECKQKLENAYDFQQQMITHDKHLRKLLDGTYEAELIMASPNNDDGGNVKVESEGELLFEDHEELDSKADDEIKEDHLFIENTDDDSTNDGVQIKIETSDGFEEVDIPLNDDDFAITDNAYANESNKVLAKLAFQLPRPKDFTAPEDSRLLYQGTTRHYQCLKCQNVYSPRNRIVHHLKTCNGVPKDDGEVGEFTEERQPSLTLRERRKLGHEPLPKPKTYFCDKCPRVFKHSGTLKAHKQRHEGNLPFACPCCSARFLWQVALDKHMRT